MTKQQGGSHTPGGDNEHTGQYLYAIARPEPSQPPYDEEN